MNVLDYADVYDEMRGMIVPAIRKTGADPDNKEAMTYAVYVVTFEPMTGQPKPAEVVGINRMGVLAQIEEWRAQIVGLEKKIANTQLFLDDADKAPLVENPV